jgi:hypothetical protein
MNNNENKPRKEIQFQNNLKSGATSLFDVGRSMLDVHLLPKLRD